MPHMREVRLSMRQAMRVWYELSFERRITICLDGMAFYAAKSEVPAWLSGAGCSPVPCWKPGPQSGLRGTL